MIEYLSVWAKLSHSDVIRPYHNKLWRRLTHYTISPTSLKINKSTEMSLSVRPRGGSSTIKKSNYLFDISSRWLNWYGYLQNYPKCQFFKSFCQRCRLFCLDMNIWGLFNHELLLCIGHLNCKVELRYSPIEYKIVPSVRGSQLLAPDPCQRTQVAGDGRHRPGPLERREILEMIYNVQQPEEHICNIWRVRKKDEF